MIPFAESTDECRVIENIRGFTWGGVKGKHYKGRGEAFWE